MKDKNVISERSFELALEAVLLYKELKRYKEFVIGRQLLRSGTSVAANVEEGLAAQSGKDFIHKLSISRKEARETKLWIRLIKSSELVPVNTDALEGKCDEVVRLLTSIIKTMKSKYDNKALSKDI